MADTNVRLYCNLGSPDITDPFVTSEVDTQRAPVPTAARKDSWNLELAFVDAGGGFASESGDATVDVRVSIGDATGGSALHVTQSSWPAPVSNIRTAEFDFATSELETAMGSTEQAEFTLEIRLTYSDGSQRTVSSAPITIVNVVYDDESVLPSVEEDFLTETETNSQFIRVRTDITGETGGTSTDLDSIVTASGIVPRTLFLPNLGNGQMWLRVSGTESESAGQIVRPDDYAASTNEQYWIRLL